MQLSTLSKDCAVEYFMHYYMEMRREKLEICRLSYCYGNDKYIKVIQYWTIKTRQDTD